MKLAEQRCANCNAYLPQGPTQGVCRDAGPHSHVTGKRMVPAVPEGGLIRAGAPSMKEEAEYSSVFAPVLQHGWCRGWEPKGWNHWAKCWDAEVGAGFVSARLPTDALGKQLEELEKQRALESDN